MSLLIYGDPHGEWRPLLAAVAEEVPDAVVILGDCDLVRPLPAELTPVSAAGVEVAYLYGNHEKDLPAFWDNLVGDHPDGLLHATVRRLGPYEHAGVAGVFKKKVWLPPAEPLFDTRSQSVSQLAHHERWRGGLPLRQRDAVFPEDVQALKGRHADILVAHEAPSMHRYGFPELDFLARDLGARLIIRGHHHMSCTGISGGRHQGGGPGKGGGAAAPSMGPAMSSRTLEEDERVGRYGVLRDNDGRLHAVSAGDVGAVCETDEGAMLTLPGGRLIHVHHPLPVILARLHGRSAA